MERIEQEKQKIMEMINKISPIEINEGGVAPDKKIIKSIMKEFGIPSQKYDHSSVRGFRRPDGKGYSYDYGYVSKNNELCNGVIFHRIPIQMIQEIANKLTDQGFIITRVSDMGFDYRFPQ